MICNFEPRECHLIWGHIILSVKWVAIFNRRNKYQVWRPGSRQEAAVHVKLTPPQWQVFLSFDTTEWSGSIATSTLWMLGCSFSRRFWPNWLSTLFTHSKSRSFILILGLLCLLMGGTLPRSQLPYLWYLNIFVGLPCQRPHISAFPFIVYHTGTSDLDTSVQSALAAQMKG